MYTYHDFISLLKSLASCFCVLQIVGSLLYEQLGYKAFGLVGKLAASGSITMQNIGGKNFSKDNLGRLYAHCIAQSGDIMRFGVTCRILHL